MGLDIAVHVSSHSLTMYCIANASNENIMLHPSENANVKTNNVVYSKLTHVDK